MYLYLPKNVNPNIFVFVFAKNVKISKGQVLYANGRGSMADIDAAIESLGKVEGAYVAEIKQLKQRMFSGVLTTGNEAYVSKDYSKASKYFEKAYRITEVDTLFLYYAASTAVSEKEYDRALVLYEELKDLNYTGIEKQYFATDKESGKEVVFDKATRDLYVKAKSHIKPGERLSESKKPEIVKNVALIYVNKGDNEKAIAAMKEARAESPDDIGLILNEANVHYKMGNTEEFKNLLKRATELDPENAELQYNLGVIASESDHPEDAMGYYKKAVELDPNYINAYINSAALVLNKEQALIEEMNGLGTSKKDDLRYDELRQMRQDVYKDAIPYLEKALEIDPKNISAVKTLHNIYGVTGEKAKHDALQEIVDALEAEGN